METQHWYRHHAHLLADEVAVSAANIPTGDDAAIPSTASSVTEDTTMQDASIATDREILADMRRRLEDATGCIPLYLRCFAGCSSSTFESTWKDHFAQERRVRRVFHHMYTFYEDFKVKRGEAIWRSHVRILRSFLLGGMPYSDVYDHRYLYEDDLGVGHIACGLARDCLVAVIRQLDGDSHFVDGSFLSNMKTTRNPSMRGFLIEQACLTYIRNSGLLLPSPVGLLKPDQVVYFDAGSEDIARSASIRTPCVLYIPRPFNYRAIDAVIRRVTFGQNAAGEEIITGVLLVPIQVTVSASHKFSPAAFYPRHHVWLSDIDASVPRQHVFAWLRRDRQDSIDHQEHQRDTRGRLVATPPYTEVTVTFNTLSGDLHVNTSPPRKQSHSLCLGSAASPIPFAIPSKIERQQPCTA
ncbi:MAG: hypothetical protein Q7T57_05900 [Dehalococcoidales bacterium]|nr:hypothetical protein [Dehalococcoidales bacterium]